MDKYTYAWVQYSDEVLLLVDLSDFELDRERLIEARFSDGESCELHIFRGQSDELREVATDFVGLDSKQYIDRELALSKNFAGAGEKLVLRDLIKYDGDGQAYVKNTVLLKVM